MTDQQAAPLTAEEERQLRSAVSPSQTVTALRFGDASIRRLLATLDRDRSAPSDGGLRARIETNLRHAATRPDDDFYRGKASAFRVVLGMLDGPPNPTFVCARPAATTPAPAPAPAVKAAEDPR